MLTKILNINTYLRQKKYNFLVYGIFLLGLQSIVFAKAEPITYYNYHANSIYPVKAGLGIVTQIEFPQNEEIESYATGLSDGWLLVKKENTIYLKPKNLNVDTNMIVRTSSHQYLFELRVVSSNWKNLQEAKNQGVQYYIKFNSSKMESDKGEEGRSGKFASNMSTHITGRKTYFTNYDYATSKNAQWLTPTKVYDDGKFTYIHLPNRKFDLTGNMPTVSSRKNRKSEELLVNFRIKNNIIIVDGTYPFLILRHGSDVVGIRRNYPRASNDK